jgi:Fe-S-cluster-containing dehydrogenase component
VVEKHIEVTMEKCTGCKLCELACSAVKTGRFNPQDSRIRVALVDMPEIPVPVLLDSCDYCFGNPVCVRFCLPQSIVWKDMETKPERPAMSDTKQIAQAWLESVSQ